MLRRANKTGKTAMLPNKHFFLLKLNGDIPILRPLVLGRRFRDYRPDIDLAPYLTAKNGVSRRHLHINPRQKRFCVDPEVTNAAQTLYNSAPLALGQTYSLADNGRFDIGNVNITVRLLPDTQMRGERYQLTVQEQPAIVAEVTEAEPQASSQEIAAQSQLVELIDGLAAGGNSYDLLRINSLYVSLLAYTMTYDPAAGWIAIFGPDDRDTLSQQLGEELDEFPEQYRTVFAGEVNRLKELAATGNYAKAREHIELVDRYVSGLIAKADPPEHMRERITALTEAFEAEMV